MALSKVIICILLFSANDFTSYDNFPFLAILESSLANIISNFLFFDF